MVNGIYKMKTEKEENQQEINTLKMKITKKNKTSSKTPSTPPAPMPIPIQF
jgi:hypothetical protein